MGDILLMGDILNICYFGKKIKKMMLENLEYGFELNVCEVFFGIPVNNYNETRLINFLILIAK